MKLWNYMKTQELHSHAMTEKQKRKSKKGKVNMETLMKELSILLEEKNNRIESLEWQLEVANKRIKELKEEKKEIKQ